MESELIKEVNAMEVLQKSRLFQGMSPEEIPLKAGIFGAEAWSEEMRQDIQNLSLIHI